MLIKDIFQGRRPYFLIIILGFLIYFQVLFFGFSYLDDNTLILDNQYFLSNLSNIPEAFQTDVFHLFNHSAAYYRPILTISLMLDYQLGKIAPFMYHFTNVILHVVASCLVFLFFQKLNYRKDLALFFSLIFTIHPVLAQAAAWIPGRNDSLLAVFVLLMSILLIEYLQKNSRKYLFWFLIFFTLALFTKESAIFCFPIVAFYLYFISKEKKNYTSMVYIFGGLAAISIMWVIIRYYALGGSAGMDFFIMLKSIILNFPAVIQFIGKILFPFNLSVLPIMQDTTFIYGIIAIVAISIAFFFTKEKRWSFMLLGLGWFFAFLLPSFIRPNTELVADFIEHRLYVPIIGFFIFLLEIDIVKKINFKRSNSLIAPCVILIIFSSITIIHSRTFANRTVFWKNAVKNSPHYPLAHRNLGAMLFLDGKMDAAKPEFEKALELNPTEEMAHNNLGLVYLEKGDFSKAEEEFNKELEVNPYYDNAYANKGLLYYRMGKMDEAVDSWKKTLEVNPGYSQALYNLFVYYYQGQDEKNSKYWAQEAENRGIPLLPEMQKMLNPLESIILNK